MTETSRQIADALNALEAAGFAAAQGLRSIAANPEPTRLNDIAMKYYQDGPEPVARVQARAKALADGQYVYGDGHVATLASLHDAHLVNALLASLAAGEPAGITEPLTVEVDRRGLRGRAMEKAEQRTGPHA